MAHEVFGDPDGQPVVYLHGAPGAACEAAFLDAAAKANGLCILALAREQVTGDSSEAYLRQLTAEVVQLVGERPLHLIGFSIGASLALRIAARLPTPAAGIWLVSAAAPLELPGSLDGMGAGRYTFALARRYPRLFAGLAAYQGWLGRHFPAALLGMLFQGAQGADASLLGETAHKAQLLRIQRQGFARGAAAYVRDVQTYVQPWAASLAEVRAPVQLWHGELDNWAPLGMPRNLLAALAVSELHTLPGLSHYSCLLAASAPLCAQVAASLVRAKACC